MRGLDTPVTRLRKQVFKEIAKVAYSSKNIYDAIEAIPYIISPGDTPHYRESIYRERAIASERVRLAMGMSLRPEDHPVHITSGLEESNIAQKYYEPPLIQVIPSACNSCAVKRYQISDQCCGCMAHPCQEVCPTDAISMINGRSHIDQEKCIQCGKCKASCPYDAISKKIRPCAAACGVDAIESDDLGRARINTDRCVSCGMCMVNCPFGAIADKSQIFQLIRAMQNQNHVIAEVAPAIIGQFGENVSAGKIKAALLELGFYEVYEVAMGADIGALKEAHHYVDKVVSGELPFLLTSCCPSWSMLAKKFFPETINKISNALTPMVATARSIKQKYPDCKVVFIGPCAAKKLEASRRSVRSDVDFVITFEELSAMFEAKGIDIKTFEKEVPFDDATGAGRGYAVAGGVADAIEKCIHEYYNNVDVLIEHAQGLSECRRMLMIAKTGKMDGCLIEGMACPGGCVGGAGTNIAINRSTTEVKKFVKNSKKAVPNQELTNIELL